MTSVTCHSVDVSPVSASSARTILSVPNRYSRRSSSAAGGAKCAPVRIASTISCSIPSNGRAALSTRSSAPADSRWYLERNVMRATLGAGPPLDANHVFRDLAVDHSGYLAPEERFAHNILCYMFVPADLCVDVPPDRRQVTLIERPKCRFRSLPHQTEQLRVGHPVNFCHQIVRLPTDPSTRSTMYTRTSLENHSRN